MQSTTKPTSSFIKSLPENPVEKQADTPDMRNSTLSGSGTTSRDKVSDAQSKKHKDNDKRVDQPDHEFNEGVVHRCSCLCQFCAEPGRLQLCPNTADIQSRQSRDQTCKICRDIRALISSKQSDYIRLAEKAVSHHYEEYKEDIASLKRQHAKEIASLRGQHTREQATLNNQNQQLLAELDRLTALLAAADNPNNRHADNRNHLGQGLLEEDNRLEGSYESKEINCTDRITDSTPKHASKAEKEIELEYIRDKLEKTLQATQHEKEELKKSKEKIEELREKIAEEDPGFKFLVTNKAGKRRRGRKR